MPAIRIVRPPMPPAADVDSDALRRAVMAGMQCWAIPPGSITAGANVTRNGFAAWLSRHAEFRPTPEFLSDVRGAFMAAVQQRAWDYLAAWDPEGVGRYRASTETALRERRAEMERRLAATRAGAAEFLP